MTNLEMHLCSEQLKKRYQLIKRWQTFFFLSIVLAICLLLQFYVGCFFILCFMRELKLFHT